MKKIIKIEGMSCNHCKMSVEDALKKIDGVQNVSVNLEEKTAIIEIEKELDNQQIINTIDEIGFDVIEIQ